MHESAETRRRWAVGIAAILHAGGWVWAMVAAGLAQTATGSISWTDLFLFCGFFLGLAVLFGAVALGVFRRRRGWIVAAAVLFGASGTGSSILGAGILLLSMMSPVTDPYVRPIAALALVMGLVHVALAWVAYLLDRPALESPV